MQVDDLLWGLVLRLTAPTSTVVAHCPGHLSLRGRIAWEPQLGPRPHRIAVTETGLVLLVDLACRADRATAIDRWCQAHSAVDGWTFQHIAVTRLP